MGGNDRIGAEPRGGEGSLLITRVFFFPPSGGLHSWPCRIVIGDGLWWEREQAGGGRRGGLLSPAGERRRGREARSSQRRGRPTADHAGRIALPSISERMGDLQEVGGGGGIAGGKGRGG